MIVLPDQPNKLRWDAGISMVCVLVAVLTPFRIAFAHNDAKGWLSFDATVDVLFVMGKDKKAHVRGGGRGHTRLFCCTMPVTVLERCDIAAKGNMPCLR